MAKVEKRALGTILTMKLHSVGNMKLKKRKICFSKQIQNTLTLSQLGVGGRLCPTIGFASPKMSCHCILVELCSVINLGSNTFGNLIFSKGPTQLAGGRPCLPLHSRHWLPSEC